ncbi:hypothetical protein AVEN_199708-1 [Araneus ventricosus]|uniref:Uncharacterized protein n=1 Tax=Araneus ventricosus TaxID=182803 RepID=A0A4Y2H0F7_ARAVE|nr:hypothetical protein AVEN_199708-1 [Araneus ventricosus]
MPRHRESTLRGIVKCRAKSTISAIIAVREVKPFEVGRERAMLREDSILKMHTLFSSEYAKLQRKRTILWKCGPRWLSRKVLTLGTEGSRF